MQQVRTGHPDKEDFGWGDFKFNVPPQFLSTSCGAVRETPPSEAEIIEMNKELIPYTGGILSFENGSFWLRVKVVGKWLQMFYKQLTEFEELTANLRGAAPIIAITSCLAQYRSTPSFSPFYGTQSLSGNPCGVFIVGVASISASDELTVAAFDPNDEIKDYIASCRAKESAAGLRRNMLVRVRDDNDDEDNNYFNNRRGGLRK